MDVHGALVLVTCRRKTPTLADVSAVAGLPLEGADIRHGVLTIDSRRGLRAFRGCWTREVIEAARRRGIDVAVDVPMFPPQHGHRFQP